MASSDAPAAIVTGAGSGVGRATALELASRGFRLCLAGRRRAPLEETAALLQGGASLHLAQPADVSRPQDCAELVAQTLERFGRIDALVNNAGFAPAVPISQTTPQLLREVFEVNALGPARLIVLCWPIFERQRSGRIVNVSTIGVDDPFPGLFAYASAKASLHTMTRSCATEGAAIGVRAFAVAPGAVETAMLRGIVSVEQLPPERTLAPEDVARVVAACAAGERDGDNGRVIRLPSP